MWIIWKKTLLHLLFIDRMSSYYTADDFQTVPVKIMQHYMKMSCSLDGFLYLAQYKWRNGENNRTLTLALSLSLSLTLTMALTLFFTLNLTLKLTIKALRHLHCAEYR